MIWVNFVANLILTLAFMLFLLFVFGRTNSKIYALPWYKTIVAKVGLATCAMGSLLNTLTLSDPPASEVLLNVGLAALFSWASVFHYKTFVVPYQQNPTAYEINKTVSTKRKSKPKMANNRRFA